MFYLLPQKFHRKKQQIKQYTKWCKKPPSKAPTYTLTSMKHFFVLFFTCCKGNSVVNYDQRYLRSSLALSNKELISFTYSSSSIHCSKKIMTKLHLRDCITHSLHVLFLKELLMCKQVFLIIPRQIGFCKSLWWGTLSKSLLKSRYTLLMFWFQWFYTKEAVAIQAFLQFYIWI